MSVIFLFFNRTAFSAKSSDRFVSLDAPLPIVSGFSCQRRSSEGNLFNGLRYGEQLPGIRNLAEKLSTVPKILRYKEIV